MHIDRINLKDFPPIKNIDIQISSNLVIIAGANGSGKTRLQGAIVYSFVKPDEPQVSLSLKATRPEEEDLWQSKSLDVVSGKSNQELRKYLSTRVRENSFVGSLVKIESNRSIRPVPFQTIISTMPDPDEQGLDHSWYLDSVANRWERLVNYIYTKSAIRETQQMKFMKENQGKTYEDAQEAFPDPFLPYQKIFNSFLPGKTLNPINPNSPSPREFEYSTTNSQVLPFASLSSGEREIVIMLFDLAYKEISHSVVLIDEPELHLHPFLVFRFVETLKGLGEGTNQIILFTHSADLISTYYSTGNVFIIDPSSNDENQAYQLSKITETHSSIAREISSNLGIFAVSKSIIFVEGNEASYDRLIYSKILQNVFPSAQITPIGSVLNIHALRAVVDDLTNTIFGVDLFLVRDRDGLSSKGIDSLEANARFKCLPRQHIENYLLDEEILSEVAKNLNLETEKIDIAKIKEALLQIASENVLRTILWNVSEYIRVFGGFPIPKINKNELNQMTPDQLAKEFSEKIKAGFTDVSEKLAQSKIEELIIKDYENLNNSLQNNDWIKLLKGKYIFNRFCSEFFKESPEKIRDIYTDIAIKVKPGVFQDIIEIFETFKQIKESP